MENIQIREVGVLETEFIEAKIGDLLQADLPTRENCKSTSINEIGSIKCQQSCTQALLCSCCDLMIESILGCIRFN